MFEPTPIRAVVLARSTECADRLTFYPRTEFVRVTDLRHIGGFGLYVYGKNGPHNFNIARVARALTRVIAWDLFPLDQAKTLADVVIEDPNPQFVINAVRDIGWRLPGHPASAPKHPSLVTLREVLADAPSGGPLPSTPSRSATPPLHASHRQAIKASFAMVRSVADREGIDPALALAVCEVESGFNVNALSTAGAMGLFQLMPATARQMKVTDPWNGFQNAQGGIALLRIYLKRYGNRNIALTAYHSGGTVGNRVAQGGHISAVDLEYIKRVDEHQRAYDQLLQDAIISEGP